MENFRFIQSQSLTQETQKTVEIHKFYNFVILAQQSEHNPKQNEVISIEMNSIDKLIKQLKEIKSSLSN